MTIQTLIASVIITILPYWSTIPNSDLTCDEVGGVWINSQIYICEDWDEKFSIAHELAHEYYQIHMTSVDKEKYLKLYLGAKKQWLRAFYRDYSMGDVEEDFCDNFAVWRTWEKRNILVEKRIKFIKRLFN